MNDVSDDAVFRQDAEVVDFARTECAEKRALERRTPCLCVLRVIRCGLLEIRVIPTSTARIRPIPLVRKTKNRAAFLSRTNTSTPNPDHGKLLGRATEMSRSAVLWRKR